MKGANFQMSMADLKSRMTDIPGAASMIMTMDAGQMVYTVNGQNFEFDAAASDAAIEATIRAGLVATATDAAPAAPTTEQLTDVAPAPAADAAPVAAPAPAVRAASAPVAPAHAALSVKDLIAGHKAQLAEIQVAQMQLLKIALDKQVATITGAVTNVTSAIEAETDDFLAIMGQFKNDLG